MNRIVEFTLLLVFISSIAQASGGIGGSGGSGRAVIVIDPVSRTIYFPGQLDDCFEILPHDATVAPGTRTYYLDANDFVMLQNAQDTLATFEAQGADGSTKSYRVKSGDQLNQVEMIDRRAAIRSDIN